MAAMAIGVGIEFGDRRKMVTDVEKRSQNTRAVENLSQDFCPLGEPYANFSFMML